MTKVIEAPPARRFVFMCPGCRQGHCFWIPPWTFNGDMDKPTVRASILVRQQRAGREVCHSFITDGRIEYLSDCSHPMEEDE